MAILLSSSFFAVTLIFKSIPPAYAQPNGTTLLPFCTEGPTVFVTLDSSGSTIGEKTVSSVPAVTVSVFVSGSSSSTLSTSTTSTPTTTSTTTASATSTSTSSSSSLDWQPCSWGQDARLQCATLIVPLDYTVSTQKRADNQSDNTMELPLFRVPARSSTPRNESILFNPGGPGGSGVEFMYNAWRQWFTLFGDDFHLIGFDPRGVNNTMPYSCDIPDDLDNDDVVFWTQSQSTIQQQLDLNTQIFSACQASNPVQGTLVGTSFVARDMMQLVDALGGDGLLRYVGVSYGTLIGDTVAAMFPDRMGRVILDGNVDPIDYYHGDYADNFDDTDLALAAFFDGCAKYPNLCNLTSASNMTGAQLEQQFLDHMDLLAKGNYSGPDAVQVERVTFSSLYHPNQYRSLSASLQKTYNRITPTTTTNTTRRSLDPITNPPTKTLHQRAAEASFIFKAIRCGDGRFGGVNLTVSDMEAILEDYDPYDEKFLLEVVAANVKSCANWPQRAKEIYSGNFNVQTKHGILYINSPYDPITPYSSAEKASALFPGSVILTHNGYGHSSIADYSTCTLGYYRSYMRDGTLPAVGTECQANIPLFSSFEVDIFDYESAEENELAQVGRGLQAYWAQAWGIETTTLFT